MIETPHPGNGLKTAIYDRLGSDPGTSSYSTYNRMPVGGAGYPRFEILTASYSLRDTFSTTGWDAIVSVAARNRFKRGHASDITTQAMISGATSAFSVSKLSIDDWAVVVQRVTDTADLPDEDEAYEYIDAVITISFTLTYTG